MGGDSSSLKSSRQGTHGGGEDGGGEDGERKRVEGNPLLFACRATFSFRLMQSMRVQQKRSCYAQKQWQHLVAHPFSFVLSKSQKCLETRRGLPTFRSHCLARLDKARRITQQHQKQKQKQQQHQQQQKSSLLDNQLKIAACNYSQAQLLHPFPMPSIHNSFCTPFPAAAPSIPDAR